MTEMNWTELRKDFGPSSFTSTISFYILQEDWKLYSFPNTHYITVVLFISWIVLQKILDAFNCRNLQGNYFTLLMWKRETEM